DPLGVFEIGCSVLVLPADHQADLAHLFSVDGRQVLVPAGDRVPVHVEDGHGPLPADLGGGAAGTQVRFAVVGQVAVVFPDDAVPHVFEGVFERLSYPVDIAVFFGVRAAGGHVGFGVVGVVNADGLVGAPAAGLRSQPAGESAQGRPAASPRNLQRVESVSHVGHLGGPFLFDHDFIAADLDDFKDPVLFINVLVAHIDDDGRFGHSLTGRRYERVVAAVVPLAEFPLGGLKGDVGCVGDAPPDRSQGDDKAKR